VICQGHAEFQRDVDAECELLCFTHLAGLAHERMREGKLGRGRFIVKHVYEGYWNRYLILSLKDVLFKPPPISASNIRKAVLSSSMVINGEVQKLGLFRVFWFRGWFGI
jgi:hypothetical protein